MPQFSRRTFLAGSAAAPLLSALAAETRRHLLTSAWPAAKVAELLLPRDRYHPFPPAAERSAWEALPADARSAMLQRGEKQLKRAWEVMPATLFLEFARNGNRSRFEAVRNRRHTKLQDLVMAECMEGQGRFADEIANGVWLICEESFWGLPAHLGQQRAGVGLPDVAEPIVELLAAETANLLSWTAYLVGPQLTAVSWLLPERIRLEIDRRILSPCLTRDDFGWMGFTGRQLNNWTPWICSNWIAAALLEEFDEKRRQTAVCKALRCLDNFLDGYADDGGCDEGPGYWDRAAASLFDCLELLDGACAGSGAAVFRQPLLREMGRYICRAHIYDDWYTNFGDAPARVAVNGHLVYRFGKRVDDPQMMRHGAFAAFFRDAAGIPGQSLGRQLPALFNLAELRQAPRQQALQRDVWLPGIQVMAARVKDGSAEGLYLAAQGGHNGKSHNHNDVGNFLVYANGQPAIVDVGVETYTAQTFSAQRYEIWTMQSAFHNCPTIDGVMQSPGRQFRASDVEYHADDNAAEFRLNIATAYPEEANLDRWNRTLRLLRGKNEIELVDEFGLKQSAKAITLTLMTPCPVAQPGEGVLALADTVKVFYDPQTFTPVIEEIKLEDSRLRSTWGERLFRILLRAGNPKKRAVWTTRITQ
jgi:hypothetical protein